MQRSLLPIVLSLLFLSPLYGQQVFYFPQVGNGVAGSLQFLTEIVLVNTTGSEEEVMLSFFSPEGDPLSLPLVDLGTNSQFSVDLPAGHSTVLVTSGAGDLQVGYAEVTTSAESGIGGTAVFTGVDVPSDTVLFEAGVPSATANSQFTVVVDTIGDRRTGLAFVRPPNGGAGPDDVILTLYDDNFTQIATTNIPLAEGERLSRFVDEFFAGDQQTVDQATEMQGTLTYRGPNAAAVTLRQTLPAGQTFPDAVPTLTTFPVTLGSADAPVVSNQARRLDTGEVLVTVLSSPAAKRVRYRVHSDGPLIGEYDYSLSGFGIDVHRLVVDSRLVVESVEVLLLDSGDSVLDRDDLEL